MKKYQGLSVGSGALLSAVRVSSVARDFSPRVSFQCRPQALVYDILPPEFGGNCRKAMLGVCCQWRLSLFAVSVQPLCVTTGIIK